jgi:hypothetical protein
MYRSSLYSLWRWHRSRPKQTITRHSGRRRLSHHLLGLVSSGRSRSNPRQLIGERDGQDVTMQALSRSREPGSKAVLCPARRMKLNGTGALDEEHPQIAITTLGDAAKYRAITGRHLPRNQTKPGGKIAPLCKGGSIADSSDHRACDDRACARNSHQPSAAHVSTSQTFNLVRYRFDPLIEMCPIFDQVSDDSDHAGR